MPGTDGIFDFLADSFTLPKGAKNPGGSKDWLMLVGSADGQKAFNLAKGSIPARSDVAETDFPAYQQSAMKSFKSDKIVSSITHGAAVNLGCRREQVSTVNALGWGGTAASPQRCLHPMPHRGPLRPPCRGSSDPADGLVPGKTEEAP